MIAIVTEKFSGMNIHYNCGSVFVVDMRMPFRM
jgi:hypothetical protein